MKKYWCDGFCPKCGRPSVYILEAENLMEASQDNEYECKYCDHRWRD